LRARISQFLSQSDLATAPTGHTGRLDAFTHYEPGDDEDAVMALWRLETEARRMSEGVHTLSSMP
jgi:hypothetical protein